MRPYRLSRTGEKIPLLSEVLRLVDGKVPLLIEVKLPSADTEVCRRLDEELQGYRGKYMVQSFNSLVLRWMKKHRNEIPRGQLSENLTRKEPMRHWFCRSSSGQRIPSLSLILLNGGLMNFLFRQEVFCKPERQFVNMTNNFYI